MANLKNRGTKKRVRRPRGNWTFGGLWVSWGPTKPPPSAVADFSVLVPETSERGSWVEKRRPTAKDYRAIINGMAALLASGRKP